MEELRSTDALDREILEDARKKADKILKTAEAAISKAQAEWAARIEHDITEMQGRIETATRERIDEIQGRMPLDRRRLRSEFAGNALKSSLNSWLDALPREHLLSLLSRALQSRLPLLPVPQERVKVYARGLDEIEIASLLTGLSYSLEEEPQNAGDCDSDDKSCERPALRISTSDISIRVSIDELAQGMLSEKRSELSEALLGKGVLND